MHVIQVILSMSTNSCGSYLSRRCGLLKFEVIQSKSSSPSQPVHIIQLILSMSTIILTFPIPGSRRAPCDPGDHQLAVIKLPDQCSQDQEVKKSLGTLIRI